jgi:hypothetical protein
MPTALLLMLALANAQTTTSSSATPTAVRPVDPIPTAIAAPAVSARALTLEELVQKALSAARPRCTIRVFKADPVVDRGIELALGEAVDRGMVREGECSQ